MDKFIIFVGENHGESDKTGEPYHVYKFFHLFVDLKTGVMRSKQVDLFAKKRIPGTSSIDFGAVVDLKFEPSEEIGGRPNLVNIEPILECPYHELMK